MSTAPTDAGKAGKPPKAKGGLLKLLFMPLVFVAGAAAGGFGGAIGARQFGGSEAGGGGHAEAPAPVAASPVEYVEIDNAFTSNLADTGRYLQLRVSVSTSGGAPTVAAIARHKPALISAVLSVLGEMGEADVANRAAKDKLRDRLKTAINQTLKDKGIIAGIDDVFFTSLVIQ